jgi:hypothetical protein
MMMYPPPRQEGPPEPTYTEPPESSTTGTKRKRKSVTQGGREHAERGSDEDTAAASTSDVPRPVISQQVMQTSSADLKKRTKTVIIDVKLAPTVSAHNPLLATGV